MGCRKLTYYPELKTVSLKKELTTKISSQNACSSYLFGFNGQEKDDEVAGAGNINTAMFWEYDTRLGRRWNLDPKEDTLIKGSLYSTFQNNPIYLNDANGDCPLCLFAAIALIVGVNNIAVAPTNNPKVDKKNIEEEKNQQDKNLIGALALPGIVKGAVWIYDALKNKPKIEKSNSNQTEAQTNKPAEPNQSNNSSQSNIIDKFKNDNQNISIKPNEPKGNQEFNVTLTDSESGYIMDIRVETHVVPKRYGGNGITPQRHMNIDVKTPNGNPVSTPNGGHIILE